MGNHKEPPANRREIRKQLIERHQFYRVDVRLQQPDDLPRSRHLNEYLYTAAMQVNSIAGEPPLRARIAQFADMSFVHTIVPEISITWQRDALSVDRALLLIVKEGSLRFLPHWRVITREPHAHLVLPGDKPIQIDSSESGTELIYISFPSRLAPDALSDSTHSHMLASLPTQVFAPIYSFVASICALSLDPVPDLSPLQKASEEIVRTAVRMILGEIQPVEGSLFQRAMEIIVAEYRDKRLRGPLVAQRLDVSLRTLQQRFAEEGTTLSETIRRVRSMAAMKLREERPSLSRVQIADLTGFGSVDSLDRAMKLVNELPSASNPLEF